MSKFYQHKEFKYIVRTDGTADDFVCVILPGGTTARLDMTPAEFDEQFEPCKTREVDLYHTVLGFRELDLYFEECVPAGFAGDDRLLKIVVSYDEIIEAFWHRAVVPSQPKE